MPSDPRHGRVPPQNIEAERSTLGCCLMGVEPLVKVTAYLEPDDFYEPAHQMIYEAMTTLVKANRPVDSITVSDELEKAGQLEEAGGLSYIAALPDAAPSFTAAMDYAEIVRNKAQIRRLITALDRVMEASFNEEADSDSLIDLAAQNIFAIREGNTIATMEPISEILRRTVTEIYNRSQGKDGDRTVKTGYPSIDHALGGLGRGTLNIIAARPGMGKSALALNLVLSTALQYKSYCIVFSLEMSKEEIGQRFLSSRAMIDSRKLRTGRGLEDSWQNLTSAATELYQSYIYVDDSSAASPLEMLSRCRQLSLQHKLDLVVIDYMQLMSVKGSRRDNRQQEISDISRSLKLMARELDVPVIALSQLNRAVEQRESKKPVLSDLRESGSIEQDADTVMFLNRPDYYADEAAERKEVEPAELNIAKNRSGATQVLRLGWMPQYTLFIDPSSAREPDAYTGRMSPDQFQSASEQVGSAEAPPWEDMTPVSVDQAAGIDYGSAYEL